MQTTAAFTAVEDNGEPGQDLTPADLVRSLPQPLVELILDFHVDKLIFGPDSLRAHLERTKTLDASTNLLLARRLLYTLERGPIHQLERLVWSRRPILHGANPLFRCYPDEHALEELGAGLPGGASPDGRFFGIMSMLSVTVFLFLYLFCRRDLRNGRTSF